MSLGENFPPSMREDFIKRNLKAGAIIRFHTLVTDPPKFKWFLVVCLEPLTCFIINTEIPPYYSIEAREALKVQVKIQKSKDSCFDGDCWLDCFRLIEEFTFDEMFHKCCNGDAVIKGHLCQETLNNIMEVVNDCDTLTPIEKNLIISNLPN